MHAEIVPSIANVDASDWNHLTGTDCPFLRHEFLLALEESKSVGDGTGWQPCHLLLRGSNDSLQGAMPLYMKTDSWGEFVFDFAWADAYQRSGLHYYPKLVAAVPFTPATSPCCLIHPDQDSSAIRSQLVNAARQYAGKLDASSLHLLFPSAEEIPDLEQSGMMIRKDCQFHWLNKGYASFDDFLNQFTAVKRKKVRRERRRVSEAGINFNIMTGSELDETAWQKIMPLYANSFLRRGREPYLNETFFKLVAQKLPEHIIVILAEVNEEPIATAICFRSSDTLYGRYWGSSGRYHSLHFETCYYQGIDYCIAHGIDRFEPGTQGEHKISRGFVPSETWSAHWLSHPQFASAVDDYLNREREHIEDYMDTVREHVPYRRESD